MPSTRVQPAGTSEDETGDDHWIKAFLRTYFDRAETLDAEQSV